MAKVDGRRHAYPCLNAVLIKLALPVHLLLPHTSIWLCCAQVEDVAEAALLPFKLTGNALPLEIVLQTGKNYKK